MKKSLESPLIVAAVTTLTALVVVGVAFWRQRRRLSQVRLENEPIPTEWIQVGEVSELILYPLKGGKRKCITTAHMLRIGPKETVSDKLAFQDRIFVVFNDKKEFMNGRKINKLMLVDTNAVDNTRVKFSFPDAEDLVVKIPDHSRLIDELDVYKAIRQTVDCGEEAAEWFSSKLLGQPSGLRLGCFIPSDAQLQTLIDGNFTSDLIQYYPKFRKEYLGAYADIASYMLLGEESVKDLNSRLDSPVTEHNFRPNILVKGSPAYSEDTWDWVKIGDNVVLRSFKYCTRCLITSVNPETAEADPKFEPLRTLRKYRLVKEPHLKKKEGSSPVMGLYLGCHQEGTVRVGDPVYINSK